MTGKQRKSTKRCLTLLSTSCQLSNFLFILIIVIAAIILRFIAYKIILIITVITVIHYNPVCDLQ